MNYVGKQGVLTMALLKSAQVKVLRQSRITGMLTVQLTKDYNRVYKEGEQLHVAPYDFREQGDRNG